MIKTSSQWLKIDYVKDRTEYWKQQGLPKYLAVDCAKEDWKRYCEKYGYDSTK